MTMLYIEYEHLKKKYHEKQKRFQKILDKKATIFQKTQPQSVAYDQDRVSGGVFPNKADTYVIELEKLGDELEYAEMILGKWLKLIKLKEEELRESKHTDDVVYCLRFLDRMKITDIALKICYSESSVNRIIRKIRDNIEDDRK